MSAVLFEPADPPRRGRLVFFHPDGAPPEVPAGVPARAGGATVATGPGGTRTVPVLRAGVGAAGLLDPGAHPAAAFWAAAARTAWQLIARGRLLPGLSDTGRDAWRVGPLDADDLTRVRRLAAAMPPEARAVPLPGTGAPRLPDAETLLRAFLDAVADDLPRTPAAGLLAGGDLFAAARPGRPAPELRDWAAEIAADTGIRLSLRLDLAPDLVADTGALRLVVQMHGADPAAPPVDAAALWHADDARFGPHTRIGVMRSVRRAATLFPPLRRLLDAAVPDAVELTDDEVGDLLGDAGARLAAAGVAVHRPRELSARISGTAVLGGRSAPPSDVPSFLAGGGLLDVDWRLALGDQPLSDAELDALAEAHRPLVRLRDRWVLVDPATADRLRRRPLPGVGALDALGAALAGTLPVPGETDPVPVAAGGWLDALRRRIADPDDSDDDGEEAVGPPAGLAGTLRDYQRRGLRWLVRMTALGLGGCLADDMGLGKTITLIALHLHRRADPSTAGPTLVVCPASLLGNWQREIGRFAPGEPVYRYHGAGRALPAEPRGFVLTTYTTMRLDADRLRTGGWGLVVADEAQHVKNPSSSTARALRTLPARSRVALTGTPVENNLTELWAILDWTTPGLLGTLGAFRRRWARPVESGTDPAAAARLAALVRPFLLRRRKSDPGIAPELPARTSTDRPVALGTEQAGLYEAVVREMLAEIRDSTGMTRRGRVVRLLTALKQVCNHPAQYLREPAGTAVLSGRSGKLDALDELLDTVTAAGGAALVFTQYVAMARLLERHLADRGTPTLLLHGGTPVARREQLVEAFQRSGENPPVFLLSLKAAGTGLNLTRADHVVHFDRWWNPAVEQQATDRAYRIGQTRPVQVHRLITEGTIEDRIADMLVAKQALADAVLAGGEAALTELSDTELAELVTLRGTA